MGKPSFSPSALLGTGLGFLGVGLSLITPEKYPALLIPYDVALRTIGIVTIGIGTLLLALAALKWLGVIAGHGFRRVMNMALLAELFIDFEISYALQSDLSEICSLGKVVIGDNHAPEDLLRSRLAKCPQIIRKLTTSDAIPAPIHGYYITYPLTKRGVGRIDKKQVTNGKSLQEGDLAATFSNAKAIYISMIFGDGMRAKAAALLHLKNDIKHLREAHSKICKLYAKPSTNDGLRLLKKFKFSPIDGENGIWVLSS